MPDPNELNIPIELHNWLRIATMDLAPAARAQVREEIISRYAEAVICAQVLGLPEAEERTDFMDDLSDPWKSRCDFNARYPLAVRPKSPSRSDPDDIWRRDLFEPIKSWRRWRQLPEPVNLESWLAIAAYDLSEESQARIRAEIECHYQDALAFLIDSGQDEVQARREALAGLGSAREAWLRFSKSYPSRDDALRIARLKRDDRPLWIGMTKLLLSTLIFVFTWIVPSFSMPDAYETIILLRLLGILTYPSLGNQGFRHLKSHAILKNLARERTRSLIKFLVMVYAFVFWGPFLIANIAFAYSQSWHLSRRALLLLDPILVLIFLICITRELQKTLPLIRWLRSQNKPSQNPGPDQFA